MYECLKQVGEEVLRLVIGRGLILTVDNSGGTLLEGFGISCTSS